MDKISDSFTDIELYAQSGHSRLLRAKRYGQWWMLKGLTPEVAHSEIFNRMLDKEFDIHIRMSHPGIARAVEMTSLKGLFPGRYIVMEWIQGETLDVWLESHHPAEHKLNILGQLMDALSYIHSLGIAHRDLKPANLMITCNGNYLKIIDFGLSDTDAYAYLKQPAGTPGFISPEQLSRNVADVRNDIFSIGKIMQALQLGPRYKSVIRRCLAQNSSRYKNIPELRAALGKAAKRRLLLYIALIIVIPGIALGIALSQRESEHSAIALEKKDPASAERDTAVTLEIQEMTVADPPAKSAATPPAATPPAEAPPVSPSESRLPEALQRGIDAFEAEARIIDAKIDSLSVPVYPADFRKPEKAWKDFYYSSSSLNLTDAEYDRLYSGLERHSRARYLEWRKKVVALKNK